MITIQDIYKLQSDYSVADGNFKDSELSFGDYLVECRVFIYRNITEDYVKGNWDAEKKNSTLLNLVADFVDKHRVKVRGYVSSEGILNSELLLQDVCSAITGDSILREALLDPEVDEIQINDKDTIFVQKHGLLQPYVDSNGRVMQFINNDEIHIWLNKAIEDGTGSTPQFTDGVPLLNAKTAKNQYRVNAVHHVANTMDKPPHNFPITTVVIRKFKETHLEIDDLIRGGACTAKMGRLLTKLGKAELKLFCVGPTGSGKTTLLRIIASTIPYDKRIILVQNPTEISFFERDEMGRNVRNVVHWEVVQNTVDTEASSSATMANLISNTLRATPEVIIIGEAREPEEFAQIQRAMKTGHKTMGTYHAEDAFDALDRFASELSTASGSDFSECLRQVAKSIDIVISQYKFEDGTRRILEISEILGIDEHGEPKINKLFEFEMSGKMEDAGNGKKRVLGEFKQRGVLSKKLKMALFKAGIGMDELAEFCNADDIDNSSFTEEEAGE